MKALPDNAVAVHTDVDTGDDAVGARGTARQQCNGRRVIEIYSSQSEAEGGAAAAAWCAEDASRNTSESGDGDGERYGGGRKPKKKHRKRHHHHHRHNSDGTGRKHKKRQRRVDPIFLWAQKRETKIIRVVCENLDSFNRIRLVKKNGVWTSKPKSNVLALSQCRASVRERGDESPALAADDAELRDAQPAKKLGGDSKGSGEKSYVDLNDNSIDFVDTVCNEEDEDEQRARIDRALEMIERDPALLDDVNITMDPTETTAAIRLPEGTTIHQVKAEHHAAINMPVSGSSSSSSSPPPPLPLPQTSPPPPPPPPPLLLHCYNDNTPMQCTFGELTITSQQQQNEPLNLETIGKRSALEIRLQQPPFKKKRVVQTAAVPLPPPPPQPPQPPQPQLVDGGETPVKREFGPLSELKEVLADPRLCVPDPLLVPRARLAALVASPATEIPKLLQTTASMLPPVDPDLLAVSLSHLRSIVQQQPDFAADERSQSSNIDQMLWLSYLSSKDMTGVDTDFLLSLLLPNSSTAAQQSFNCPQQTNQWNDVYYGPGVAPTPYDDGPAAGYSKSEGCCASVSPAPLPSPKQQQPNKPHQHHRQSQMLPSPTRSRLLQKPHQKPRLPPLPMVQPMIKQQRVCRDLCCNGSPPSTCYDSCCSKGAICNPFAMSPAGCNPFVVSPTGCNPFAVSPSAVGCVASGDPKTCTAYSADGTACYFPVDIGCGYTRPAPPTPRKHVSVSPSSNRVQYDAHTADLGPRRTSSTESGSGGCGGGGCGGGGGDVVGGNQFVATANKPQTPLSPATAAPGAGDHPADRPPLQKPKIKVKKHLIDPHSKPKLLNIEGALHLAGANPQDLFSSPLWHPLFGSQEKRYGCRWQWTTPVSTPSSTSSENVASDSR